MNDNLTFTNSRLILKFVLTTTLVILGVILFFGRASGEEPISDLLSRLDQAARSFTGATAKIRVVTHTAIINEDDAQIGTVVVRRSPSAQLSFLMNVTTP